MAKRSKKKIGEILLEQGSVDQATLVAAIGEAKSSGKRVGVSSNSHKAILNLLAEVEKVAKERKVRFKGVKKSTDEDDCFDGEQIVEVLGWSQLDGGIGGSVVTDHAELPTLPVVEGKCPLGFG